MSSETLPSKDEFLRHNVILANQNDDFYNERCSFCWDTYRFLHVAMRVLPCNHIFGSSCLFQMIKEPRGNRCPICRTNLFRPTLHQRFLRRMERVEESIDYYYSVLYYAFHFLVLFVKVVYMILSDLPFWLRVFVTLPCFACSFWMYDGNPYCHANLLIDCCTNLRARNPNISIDELEIEYLILLTAHRFYLFYTKEADCFALRVQVAMVLAVRRTLYKNMNVTSCWDAWMFVGIMVFAMIMHFFSLAIYYSEIVMQSWLGGFRRRFKWHTSA